MNIELFNELAKQKPAQHLAEWQFFLEICEMYFKKYEIDNPVIVELGAFRRMQKKFWERLLGAEHIDIDISDRGKTNVPDILGDTHNPETIKILKERLNGRFIDVLFIDAGHRYEDCKKDFEMYLPLCNGIVAFHDIGIKRENVDVWLFWNELKEKAYRGKEQYKDFLFLSIFAPKISGQNYSDTKVGIGMILKK